MVDAAMAGTGPGRRSPIYNCFDDDGNIAQHYVRS